MVSHANSTENWICSTGVASLSESLKVNTTLEVLYMYCERRIGVQSFWSSYCNTIIANETRNSGATSLSESLKANTALTLLDISCKHGRVPRFHVLQITLNLNWTGNGIGETGATSLSEALKLNTTLMSLDLSGKPHKQSMLSNNMNN